MSWHPPFRTPHSLPRQAVLSMLRPLRSTPPLRLHHPPSSSSTTRRHLTTTRPTIPLRRPSRAPSKPAPPPPSSSAPHHDLPSFLQHASRAGLSPRSTVYAGTRYEYVVRAALARLGFALDRVGGAHDRGVDLLGMWTLPVTPTTTTTATTAASPPPPPQPPSLPVRVIVQCKAHARNLTPEHVRELEGAFGGAPPGWRGPAVLGLLVCKGAASRGVRDALARSGAPMGFVRCGDDGVVSQMLWNWAATEACALEGVGVTVRFVAGEAEDGGVGEEVVLTWMGRPVKSVSGRGEGLEEGAGREAEKRPAVESAACDPGLDADPGGAAPRKTRGRPPKRKKEQDGVHHG